MTNEILQRDSRWEVFYEDISLQEFVSKLPSIRFYDEVNQDVKEAFKIIHKLMIHSYYEYLFIDVAVTKALQTFEMALKLRYRELNNKEWNKKSPLEQLIEWFRKRDCFEREDKNFFDFVRGTRNYLSHPERHHFGGSFWFHWIETTIDLINDLYDEIGLRRQRRTMARDLGVKLEAFLINGARLIYQKQEFLIYGHGHILINNFVQPHRAEFSLFKIFKTGSPDVKLPLIISCDVSALKLGSAGFCLTDLEGNSIKLTNELNDIQRSCIEFSQRQRLNDVETLTQHNSLFFDSQNFMLKTWRHVRYLTTA